MTAEQPFITDEQPRHRRSMTTVLTGLVMLAVAALVLVGGDATELVSSGVLGWVAIGFAAVVGLTLVLVPGRRRERR